MVQALVEISKDANRVLNIVKAEYGLRDKAEAIELVISKYAEQQGEPELKPEFIKKMRRVSRQKSIHVRDFAARYGLKQNV